jgi:hypothetical protein
METILLGAIGGLCWAALGVVTQKMKPDNTEDFNYGKFVKPVIVGAAIGGVLAYQGVVVDASALDSFVMNSVLYMPIVAVVDKAISLVKNLFNKLKA